MNVLLSLVLLKLLEENFSSWFMKKSCFQLLLTGGDAGMLVWKEKKQWAEFLLHLHLLFLWSQYGSAFRLR